MNALPWLLLLVPLAGMGLIAAGVPAKRAALGTALVNLGLALVLYAGYDAALGGYQFQTKVPVMEMADLFFIHFHLGVDGVSLPLVLLTTLVTVSAFAVAPAEVRRPNEFYSCLLLISLGALGAFLSLDLFFLYIFHEVALIPTFILIGVWGTHDRKFAATQITLYLAFGSLVLLAGLLGLYYVFPPELRTFDLVELQEVLAVMEGPIPLEWQELVYPLILIGFGILISLWPFHSWAPVGYASAPAPVAMLHAGVLKKFGLYGLIRLGVPFFQDGVEWYAQVLGVLLLGNILYIGLVTLAQKNLDLLLGYSSVMHMGYLFLGFVSMNMIGLTGMIVLMVAHGLSTAMLFGLASVIRERTGTLALKEMGGLGTKAPTLCFLFMLGAFASIGLPGLGNFAGEVLIFFGAWPVMPLITALALWGVVLSAVYMLRAVRDIFFGEMAPAVAGARDLAGLRESWPFWLLAAALLWIGVYPKIITAVAQPSLVRLFESAGL
ncbi:MAG: NADH-quinone oxidoreductase subunit M [Candidatus Methylacidiphilales bacterium]